jgi:hypothetical protein
MKRLLALPALLALAVPAFAQDPATAAPAAPKLDPLVLKVIENLPKLKDQKWEGTHTLNVNSAQGGMNATFAVTWQDMKHFKVNLNLKTTPGQEAIDAGVPAQDITANLFADGTYLWAISPAIGEMMGGMEGIKIELALFEKMLPMAMSQMGGMAPSPEGMSEMLTGMAQRVTMKEDGSTEALKRLVFEGEGWKGELQFDAKTWFPMSFVAGSEEEKASMQFKTTAFGLKEAFAEDAFTAKGFDVSKVMDLTGMLQAQLGQFGGGGAEEDLEF